MVPIPCIFIVYGTSTWISNLYWIFLASVVAWMSWPRELLKILKVLSGLYWDNGKENGNYYVGLVFKVILGLYWGNVGVTLGFCWGNFWDILGLLCWGYIREHYGELLRV